MLTIRKRRGSHDASDLTAWLATFSEAGGSYDVTIDNRLWLGEIHVVRDLFDQSTPLRGHTEQVEAIKALNRDRFLIA